MAHLDDKNNVVDEEIEEEMEGEEDEKHQGLMAAMSKLAPKGRTKSLLRSEPGAVSEFGLSSSSAVGSGVELKGLLRSLDKTPSKADLNTQLRGLIRKKVSLDVPLYSHEAEKIQRKVAYQKVSEDIGKWDDVVKANRKAEHVSFPLTQNKVGLRTTEEFVQKFKPSTPLEEEIYQALNGSKYAETKDKELTRAEEEVLSAMSLEEAQLRRSELQKVRALQTYYESKCKRQKRIKSKSYRRVKRKAKAKQEVKRMEEMMKTDPEAATEELVKQGRVRAEERMTLRHKNTGKWAKGTIRFGKYSQEAREKIADQLEDNRALTQKIAEVVESDEEIEGSKGADRGLKATISFSDANNPWFTGKVPRDETAGDNSEREPLENDGLEFIRPAAVVAQKKGGHSTGGGVEEAADSEDEAGRELERLQSKRRMRKEMAGGEIDNSGALPGESISDSDSDMGDHTTSMGGRQTGEGRSAGTEKGHRGKIASSEGASEMDGLGVALIDEDTTRRTTEEDMEAISADPESQPEHHGLKDVIVKAREGANVGSGGRKGVKGPAVKDTSIDPSRAFMLKPKDVMTVTPELVEEGDGIHRSEHLMNIQEAFEDDDVVDDFKQEKEAAVEKGKPQPVDLTLPGWGSWGGAGIKESEKKRKRFTIPAPPAPPRKDDGVHHVIISEDRERKLAQHQVNSLPFPYASLEQFQDSIRAPIGKTWNTPSAVTKLTMPGVTTKRGTIIEPIQEEVLKKEATTKRDLPGPDIDLSEPEVKKGKTSHGRRGARGRKRKSQKE